LYNDLGYIRSGNVETLNLAYKDLETALDLHSPHVQLTLLNLSFLDLKNGDYEKAIGRIEAALLLSLSPREIGAAYLRLCVPEFKLGFKNVWEQHPANVIEASYVNVAYALLKARRDQEASNTFKEGLELMPSSVYLKHARARFYLYRKDAQSAYSVYEELAECSARLDEAMRREVDYFDKIIKRIKGKSKKRKRRR
jgi:tetratricopeptide (TPR) repeat protein